MVSSLSGGPFDTTHTDGRADRFKERTAVIVTL
jgi:hypothetical protein